MAEVSAWSHQDKEPRGIIPLENLSIREVEDSKKPVSAVAGSPESGGAALVLWLGQGNPGGAAAPKGCPSEDPAAFTTSTHYSSWLHARAWALQCPGLVAEHIWGCGVMVPVCPSLSAVLGVAVPGKHLQRLCSAISLPTQDPLWAGGCL